MSVEIELSVKGDEQLQRSFSRFADGIDDLSEPFREVARDFREVVERKQFDSEGAYGSGGWEPLSPKYAEWKGRNYPGRPIMVLSGDLRESLTGRNKWTIEDIQPLQLRLGTADPIAGYHQEGTSRMPQRRLIDLREDDKSRWMKIIHEYLVGRARKEGLL